ncbi:hypothetical protein [Sphingomonas sp.]|uniref:hypothetical protein n=1 Tax=Sphingomonas sp. TaxID=28214 RepID=UPI001B293A0A|nr:hypothetical protein [Sphingomonas sp.]MBO9714113.1 hypothetical protein [Sphingomonas sp.]
MSDQSERLRCMAEYGYHAERARRECEMAEAAPDRVNRRIHAELAALHARAADALAAAWSPRATGFEDDGHRERESFSRIESILGSI